MITDLGVLEPDPDTAELVLTALHQGVTVEQVRARDGLGAGGLRRPGDHHRAGHEGAGHPARDAHGRGRTEGTEPMSVILHHVDEGPREAPVLVLSGSLGSTVEMWRPQLPALTERFRVIRLDHRGHGGSPVPDGAVPRGRPRRRRPGHCSTRWRSSAWRGAGCRWAAWSAWSSARRHPQRLTRLTLCCTSAHYPDSTVWTDRIAAVRAGGTASIAEAVVANWFTPEFAAGPPRGRGRDRGPWSRSTPDDGLPRRAARPCEVWDHRDRLAAVAVPTLVIAGSADPSTPVEPHARTIAEGIPGTRLEMLDAAHLATIERAEEATALITAHSTSG